MREDGTHRDGKSLSLRLRLIGLIALVFALSLVVGGTIACLNASRSVAAEMDSALAVAEQTLAAGLLGLAHSPEPRRELERLVGAFQGNRHLRVALAGDAAIGPPTDTSAMGDVPAWFVRLIGVAPREQRIPVRLAGYDGEIVIDTVPHNEILEIWTEFADSLLVLGLFSGPSMLLVYVFIGRALRPLSRLAGALGSVGRGDYRIRIAGRVPPELAPLRDSFNGMAGQLAAMAAENRRLNEQLLGLQEQERGELARDLHDEVSPFLFAINVDVASIARHWEAGRLAPIAGHVQSIAEAVRHLQREVKGLLGRLRPAGLAEFGLADAIANLVEFWRRRHPEIAFDLAIAPEAAGLSELLEVTIYRIVQEALSNAMRHGRPRAVRIAIVADRQELVVTVSDDGGGMGPTASLGYGLTGMGERVRALGGSLTVASHDGGLAVTARLPTPAPRAAASVLA